MLKKQIGPLTWLGKYLSLALTLPASVVAGYLIGVGLDQVLHRQYLRPIFIILGMAGGIAQIVRELSRETSK